MMKKKAATVVFLVLIVIVTAALLFIRPSNRPMPVYQGKTAQQWLAEVFGTNQTQAMRAFREMGTNAFPMLIAALEKKDSAWDKLNARIYFRLPVKLRRHWPKPMSGREQEELCNAAELVLTNVRDAKRTLPDLARISMDEHCRGRTYALSLVANMANSEKDTECVLPLIQGLDYTNFEMIYQVNCGLQRLGPAARAAVPTVTLMLKDPRLDVRVLAAITLWKIDGQTNLAEAALKEALNTEGYSYMKGWAPFYLRQINPCDESLIPFFIKQLESGGETSKLTAATAIGNYGSVAKTAVPALTNLLNSPNRDLRQRAFQSLRKIDPDTAAKYEDR